MVSNILIFDIKTLFKDLQNNYIVIYIVIVK